MDNIIVYGCKFSNTLDNAFVMLVSSSNLERSLHMRSSTWTSKFLGRVPAPITQGCSKLASNKHCHLDESIYGLSNSHRRFIMNFAQVVQPLLKQGATFFLGGRGGG